MVIDLVEFLEIVTSEISLHFVSKERITELHGEFFNDPTPTDCITFPFDPNGSANPGDILGEVFICPQVAIEYTEENGGDPYQETTLYLIHGLLHLLGYDDIEEATRLHMRQAEKRCLHHLSKKNVFLSS